MKKTQEAVLTAVAQKMWKNVTNAEMPEYFRVQFTRMLGEPNFSSVLMDFFACLDCDGCEGCDGHARTTISLLSKVNKWTHNFFPEQDFFDLLRSEIPSNDDTHKLFEKTVLGILDMPAMQDFVKSKLEKIRSNSLPEAITIISEGFQLPEEKLWMNIIFEYFLMLPETAPVQKEPAESSVN